MIVESHAHYAHASFAGNFRYLSWEDNWVLKEGTLEDLLQQMAYFPIAANCRCATFIVDSFFDFR